MAWGSCSMAPALTAMSDSDMTASDCVRQGSIFWALCSVISMPGAFGKVQTILALLNLFTIGTIVEDCRGTRFQGLASLSSTHHDSGNNMQNVHCTALLKFAYVYSLERSTFRCCIRV